MDDLSPFRLGVDHVSCYCGVDGKAGLPRPASGQQWTDGTVVAIRWLTDHTSGLFYGSAFVELRSVEAASALVSASTDGEAKARGGQLPVDGQEAGIMMRGRRLRVRFSPPNAAEAWPPPQHEQHERPPVGVEGGHTGRR